VTVVADLLEQAAINAQPTIMIIPIASSAWLLKHAVDMDPAIPLEIVPAVLDSPELIAINVKLITTTIQIANIV
jgi:hypothetical protein